MELITGGTGIVGSHLLLERAMRGVSIRALARPGSDRSIVARIFRHYREDADELLERITWVEGDLEDELSLQDAMEGVRHVYHAAALVSFDDRDRERLRKVNQLGTANIVNAVLSSGVERLCHISSTAAIGSAPVGTERHEGLPWKDDGTISPYAISKFAAELEVMRGIAEGADAVILNPCVVLGPGPSGRSSMTLVDRMSKGTGFHPPGSNAVVDARDVAACASLLMSKGGKGERYLIIGQNVSYKELLGALSRAFGKTPPTMELPPWALGWAWRFEAIRTLFGGRPMITRSTARSAIEQRSWSSRKMHNTIDHSFLDLESMSRNVAAYVQGHRRY